MFCGHVESMDHLFQLFYIQSNLRCSGILFEL
jgi:hypothetical protein